MTKATYLQLGNAIRVEVSLADLPRRDQIEILRDLLVRTSLINDLTASQSDRWGKILEAWVTKTDESEDGEVLV